MLLDIQSSASIITLYNFTANLITENTIPKRLYIDGGYIDINFNFNTTSYKYYVYDHQGSVRAVLNSSGTVIQSTDYSAYGVPSTRYQMNADNRFHLGLEWQTMKGWNSYQNNARTRDPLYARFQQQDPMADKYYPFSPYHYGTCNPLRFMDFDGRKVVYSNDMSDSERFNLMETIANLRDSQLFSKVYDYLEKMKDIVTISFGETVKDQYGDNVAGQYVPNESDGGGTITFKDENSLSSFVATEEIYHSYQNAVPNTNGATNLEFEAKVFSVGVCANYLPLPQIPCLETFSKKIRSGIYGDNENNIASTNIIRFSLDYMKEGYKFSNHYLGNINYSMPVFNVPNRLLNLIY